MMKKIIEGSIAVAHTAAKCRPKVICAFPITPSTHIPEELSRIQPQYGYEFVPVEAEFSAISGILGASAAGARTFTATSSQGLALMHEVLHNASGMRLPLVAVVANRGLSAPLTIWNDWQDSISQRDTGWIQLYCKNNQETIDTVIQAYKIAESVSLPVMVCFDGFYLTHAIEPLDVPEQKEIDDFLPPFKPKHSLDINNPETFGSFVDPKYYQQFKEEQHKLTLSAIDTIQKTADEFSESFNRDEHGLVEEYKSYDADYIIISMGSMAENAEVAVDELRKEGESVGLLRIKMFRPFPSEVIKNALQNKQGILVAEKDISPGLGGALASEVKAALYNGSQPNFLSAITGLGGKDVSVENIKELFKKLKNEESGEIWF